MMRVIGLAGWSGAGKTTLLVKLIPELKRRGLAVSTLKHAHHAFEIDRPGKDSFVHREAGASEVLIASGRRWALMHELHGDAEPTLPALLRRMTRVDLVVIEGFKAYAHPKIEVHRAANGKPLLCGDVPNVRAVASDVAHPDLTVPVLHLDDVARIADHVVSCSEPIEDLVADLEARTPPPRIVPPR
jgi:molybdopterin-guanine dinucleotide biosynthesis protein B